MYFGLLYSSKGPFILLQCDVKTDIYRPIFYHGISISLTDFYLCKTIIKLRILAYCRPRALKVRFYFTVMLSRYRSIDHGISIIIDDFFPLQDHQTYRF